MNIRMPNSSAKLVGRLDRAISRNAKGLRWVSRMVGSGRHLPWSLLHHHESGHPGSRPWPCGCHPFARPQGLIGRLPVPARCVRG